MNIDEIKKDKIKRGLKHCSDVDFGTSCRDCSYRYRCKDLNREALCIIAEQEKEIKRLTEERNQGAEILARLCKLIDEPLKECEK